MKSIKKPIFNKSQVRQAAKMWRDTPGRGGFRASLRYDVEIDGKLYPPKAIASFANELAGNGVIAPKDFAGAREASRLPRLSAFLKFSQKSRP